ncbi:hypothetical protein GCM10022252_78500 [Streptosporangium oxazolinicum]|uniref:pPIWI-RE three-gene island domain-containing protein n=1 Tax=Streptosporangium oxazolinicum TaxID=909287 RepID=A0ABP8BN18_9ACTN
MTREDHQDHGVIARLARGIIELATTRRSTALRLPYPPSLQLALDQVVLFGLVEGLRVPAGVPELLSWCRAGWPMEWRSKLLADLLAPGTRLIHPAGGEPTSSCAELASPGPGGTVQEEAEELLNRLMGTCGTVHRFMACRDYLISNPVILNFDPAAMNQPMLAQTWKLVKLLYEQVPERFLVDGAMYRCTRCRLLAKTATVGGEWCEGGCQQDVRKLERSEEPRRALAIPFALRLFLALPGHTELSVRSRLTGRTTFIPVGLGVHEAVDHRGIPRVFQVQDLEQPVPAAKRAAVLADRLGRVLDILVPDDRMADLSYRQSFQSALPFGAPVRLLSVSEFVATPPSERLRRSDA